MKTNIKIFYLITAILFFEGCYTQLATIDEDERPRRRSRERINYYTESDSIIDNESKTTIINNYNYFEDDDFRRSRFRASFYFYSPHRQYGWYDPFYYNNPWHYSWQHDWYNGFDDPWYYYRPGFYVVYPYPYWYQPNYYGGYNSPYYNPYYGSNWSYNSGDNLENRRRGGGSGGSSRGDDENFRRREIDNSGNNISTGSYAPPIPTASTRIRDDENVKTKPPVREKEMPWWKKIEELNPPPTKPIREKEKNNIDENSGGTIKNDGSKKQPTYKSPPKENSQPKTSQPSNDAVRVRSNNNPSPNPPSSGNSNRKRDE
ncbi:MAG: hypothetical protein O3A55_03050 [Bacteroidetes bacterium]|nr:hypothetical protein [Bacteroidota bacterium]